MVGARALGTSPFALDPRAFRARHHPAWRAWAILAEAVEPPKLVRVAGLT
ncbi:MAG: hypothetical protein ACYDCI_05765 [Candidatus Limnocylindrales bacterium]